VGLACHAQEESSGALLVPQLIPGPTTPAVSVSTGPSRVDTADSQDGADAPESAVPGDRSWHVRYRFPVVIGYTDFELGSGEALDSLATLALVPTADFVRPLTDEWTLIPFLGLGAGWLLNDDAGVVILTGGVRAEWVRRLDEANELRVLPRVRYDANLNQPDGLLGDWGRADVAVELRHAFGIPGDAMRFEPGLYAQGFYFWDEVEFDVPGLTPDSIQTQLELGLSLGVREPIEFLWWDLPRVYIGVRSGDGAETLSLRFGEL